LGVPTLAIVRKLRLLTLLLAVNCLPGRGQSTVDAIRARLIGQPLYLRGDWMDNSLKFDAEGSPEKRYGSGTFTESGMDVREVRLSSRGLRIEGQRMGLIFSNTTPQRVSIRSSDYDGWIRIDIEAPPDGDFTKALTAVFAPDLASMAPTMPYYWQDYARNHLLVPAAQTSPGRATEPVHETNKAAGTEVWNLFPVGGAIKKPVVLHQVEPQFSDVARTLKFTGKVVIYLWVLEDGSTSHLRIVEPAGLGLDEQALLAVSQYARN
jgi:hypothetical protein